MTWISFLKANYPFTYDALVRLVKIVRILNKVVDYDIVGLHTTPSGDPPNPLDAFGKLLKINHKHFLKFNIDSSLATSPQASTCCSLCTKKMHPRASIQTSCLHTFHSYCIFKMMAQKGPIIACPICKHDLIASSILGYENGFLNVNKMEEVLGMPTSQESLNEIDTTINDVLEWWKLGYVRVLQALAFHYLRNGNGSSESKLDYTEMRCLLNRATKQVLQTGDSAFGTRRNMEEDVKWQVEKLLKVGQKALSAVKASIENV